MNCKRISVIIAVYNAEMYLEKCVESVLAQTYPAYEILLIDDGSIDDSGRICDRYQILYPNCVKVIHQRNSGVGGARNTGINVATGDFLAFIDSDDYYDPDMLKTFVELIHKYDSDMAVVEKWVDYPNGDRYCAEPNYIEKCWDTKEALIWLNSYRYIYTGFPMLLAPRSAFGDLRFKENERAEDYEVQYQVIARCKRIAYCSKPLYHYVQTNESASRTKSICLEPMRTSTEQLEFFKKNFPDILFAAETGCAIQHMAIWTTYLRCGVSCPPSLLRKLRKVVRRYLKSVLKNGYIPKIKKLQAIVFCYAPVIYKQIITNTKHR